jgi:hypothetical protein
MKILIAAMALTLGACSKDQVLLKEAQPVNIAVPTKCFKKADVPPKEAWPLDAVDLSDSKTALPKLVHAATLERDQRIKHVEAWDKIIDKCAD